MWQKSTERHFYPFFGVESGVAERGVSRRRRSGSRRRTRARIRRALLTCLVVGSLLLLTGGWVGFRGWQARAHLLNAAGLAREPQLRGGRWGRGSGPAHPRRAPGAGRRRPRCDRRPGLVARPAEPVRRGRPDGGAPDRGGDRRPRPAGLPDPAPDRPRLPGAPRGSSRPGPAPFRRHRAVGGRPGGPGDRGAAARGTRRRPRRAGAGHAHRPARGDRPARGASPPPRTRAPGCCRRCSAPTAPGVTCSSPRISRSCAPPAA